ncbi:inhibin alpha chain [Hemicordylus capensis]|uniref:inhibin alpha chain n=1 Tax=Hemicordylus capensis TaxID=884348 RepID=UPI0023048BA6|nr:inhibin alpha chain [Hemicordylus capensis]
MLAQSPLHPLSLISSMLILLLAPAAVAGCSGSEIDRHLILAKVKAHFLESLGPAPQGNRVQARRRGLHRRHASGTSAGRSWEEEDTSQVIAFPSRGVSCGPPQPDELPEDAGLFTYIFQPSSHTLSRVVASAQLWFYTGPVTLQSSSLSEVASNSSVPEAEVLKLSEQGQIPVATMAVPAAEDWTVFHFGTSFLPYISQKIFVLFVRCPACPCVADAEKIPFLVAVTKPRGRDRARRTSVPWPLGALNLLQRPSDDAETHANCHRASLNISFEELGWDRWIVHPSSFVFHYCHGSCSAAHPLTYQPNFRLCCAALPGTMHSLRVRTTSDGGYSFKYETVPNILTQDCVCI